jgi:hypothetical protein
VREPPLAIYAGFSQKGHAAPSHPGGGPFLASVGMWHEIGSWPVGLLAGWLVGGLVGRWVGWRLAGWLVGAGGFPLPSGVLCG